ncbi:Gamma-tocopherol methyltransferase, chloroplastic [Castilleja foliolosa]|uniref:Gamma-tocopherol methyltransferase, chloroplastic n=1 Tax=Castilleja foliolosa TaxID=1961234 RepID=A0ABD3DJT4_9LAMI
MVITSISVCQFSSISKLYLHRGGRGHLNFARTTSPTTTRIISSKSAAAIGCGRKYIPVFTPFRVSITRRRLMAINAAPTQTAATGTSESLRKGIAEFYDESSGIWEDIWGDHMHHGFYEPDSDVSLSDHRSAQIRMIEESLRFASLSDDSKQQPRNIVDVGCGIGGSSRYLARKYGARSQGITLSPFQAKRAQELAAAQGLDDKVSFQVADALNQPFPDGQFDLVWSMESGEHMPDKTKFVNELARVVAPGGTIIIVTWCHRDLPSSEESLNPDEEKLLNKICDAFFLPAWCSTSDYVKLLQSLSLEDIKAADWSQYVAPFWPAVIKSALTWKGITSLLRSDDKGGNSHAFDDRRI